MTGGAAGVTTVHHMDLPPPPPDPNTHTHKKKRAVSSLIIRYSIISNSTGRTDKLLEKFSLEISRKFRFKVSATSNKRLKIENLYRSVIKLLYRFRLTEKLHLYIYHTETNTHIKMGN